MNAATPDAPATTLVAAGDDLQAALDAAPAGATVRVAAGTYAGPLVLERSVRVVGEPGAVVRGAGRGSLVVVQGRGIDVALFGLTLDGGGDTNAGGGVSVPNGARLVLDGCVLRACVARGFGGGGLFIRRGEALLRGCRFEACVGRAGGAALVTNDATLRAVDCVFVGCEAAHSGAAVAVRDRGVATLSGCDLSGCVPPAAVADDLGWLVDVHVRPGTTASLVERSAGPLAGVAMMGHTPGTLRWARAGA